MPVAPVAGTPDAADARMPARRSPTGRAAAPSAARARLGIAAFGLAAVLALTDVARHCAGERGYWSAGTVLGVAASGADHRQPRTGTRRHRARPRPRLGHRRRILSVVANPWLLTRILSFFAQF